MKRLIPALAAAGIAAAGIASAAPAQAASSNVGGWTADTITCSNGQVSVFPVIVGNGADAYRYGSYTVPSAVTSAVQIASSLGDISCNGNSNIGIGAGYSKGFQVGPGEVTVMWVGLGQNGGRTADGSHNIGFGGYSSNSGGSWYDLGLTLNGTGFANGGTGFNNLTATYQGTGGLDIATSRQNGFVLTNCVTTNDGSILPGPSVLTPYNSGQWTSGPVYAANQPLCAAWATNGTYVSYTQGTSSDFTTQAAQQYQGGAYTTNNGGPLTSPEYTLLAMAGSGTAVATSAYSTLNGVTLTLPINTPSKGPWVGQDPQTLQWFAANLPNYTSGLYINGQLVGIPN